MDKRIDQYIGNAAVADWAKEQGNSITDDALNSAINHILKEKLKIDDDTITGKVLSSLKEDGEWASMLNSVKDGDPETFNQNLQILLGKKIVENVSESTLSSALGAITEDAGIEVVAKAGMPLLTPEEEEKLRTHVMRDLKAQFEKRVKTDSEIEAKEKELEMIMDMYQEAGFLEKGRWGWKKEYELETRLDVLMHFKDKVLSDTGRTGIKSGSLHNEQSIGLEQMKTIAMKWFGTEDEAEKQKVYEEFLESEFGIKMTPEGSEISLAEGAWVKGTWEGTK